MTATGDEKMHGEGWLTPKEYGRLTAKERDALRAKRHAEATAQGVAADYYAALAAMPCAGGRHDYVWRVVRVAAKRAEKVLGLTVRQFVTDCQGAPNGDGLTDRELRAIWGATPAAPVEAVDVDAVAVGSVPSRPAPKLQPKPLSPWERPPTDAERERVRVLVNEGAKLAGGLGMKPSSLLRSCSPVEIPTDRAGQAAALVTTLAAIAETSGVPDGGLWYAGDRFGSKVAPDAPVPVRTARELAKAWKDGGEAVPQQLTTNPATGEGVEKTDEKTGKRSKSYRNGDTVAARLFALVEFDEMPLTDQAAFWLGVLARGALDVVAIVYSANKSLHGIVRVPATGAGPVGSAANWVAAWGKASKRKDGPGWDVATWGPLSRLLLSSRDGEAHADWSSGSNACGLFRLAGHMRTDKLSTPTPQALLWLTSAEPRQAVPEPSAAATSPAVEKPEGIEPRTSVMPPAVDAVAVGDAEAPGVADIDEDVPPSAPVANAEAASQPYAEPRPAASIEGVGVVRRCAECPAATVAACRHVFGKYWLEKSGGAMGCNRPVDDLRDAAVLWAKRWASALARLPPPDQYETEVLAEIDAAHDPALDAARFYIHTTHVIPDWVERRYGEKIRARLRQRCKARAERGARKSEGAAMLAL